jgi:hypothetical protein
MNPVVETAVEETAVVFQDHREVHQVVAFQGPLVEVQDLQVVVETVVAVDAPEEVNKIPTFSIYKNLFCSPLAKREDFFLTTVKAYALTGYFKSK